LRWFIIFFVLYILYWFIKSPTKILPRLTLNTDLHKKPKVHISCVRWPGCSNFIYTPWLTFRWGIS